MINIQLANEKQLPRDVVEEICDIQNQIYKLVHRANLGVFNQTIYDKIEQLEFRLQGLWGFDRDSSKHRHKKDYQWKSSWIGRKFKCKETGETLIISENVNYKDYYVFGRCFIDVGDGCYSRFGGEIKEIKD